MPFLVLKETTISDQDNHSSVHHVGTVLSDWEVSTFIAEQVRSGAAWYRAMLEPLTDDEAFRHRETATAAAGPRLHKGERVDAPFSDYVGLHPAEVIDRMKKLTALSEVEQVKNFERAGLARRLIIDFTSPAEREPWQGYDSATVRQIQDKFALMHPEAIQNAIIYEYSHRKRPTIVTYDPNEVGNSTPPLSVDEETAVEPEVATA